MGAVATSIAALPVDDHTPVIVFADRFFETDGDTSIALFGTDAARVGMNELWSARLALRVRAPDTGQRAPLQKHDGAYAWTIMKRELLNVENQAFEHITQNACSVLRMISFCSAGVRSTKYAL